MNERIQEIEKQSYVDADAGDGVYQRFSMEKFAQLLVNNVLSKVGDRWSIGDIKQHFGIEA